MTRAPTLAGAEKVNEYRGPYHWYLPAFFDYLHRAPLETLFARVPPEATVLDLGAGDARLTHFLARRYKRVVALEPQDAAVQLGRLMTRLHGSTPMFSRGDASLLPFRAGMFDCVTAFDVIEHLPRDSAMLMLRETHRTLVPGGWVVVTTPNRRSLRNRIWGHRLDDKHFFELDPPELDAMLSSAGFTVRAIEGIYLTPPIPRVEHFASVFPFRGVFRALGAAGRRWPALSERLVALAQRSEPVAIGEASRRGHGANRA
jgi:SAM-dependent methyltransferase